MTPQDTAALKPCPFCSKQLAICGGVNPYGRCITDGCWMMEAKLSVVCDDPKQVERWNTRAALSAHPHPVETVRADVQPVAWRYRRKETSDPVMGNHGENNWQHCAKEPHTHFSQAAIWDIEPLYSQATGDVIPSSQARPASLGVQELVGWFVKLSGRDGKTLWHDQADEASARQYAAWHSGTAVQLYAQPIEVREQAIRECAEIALSKANTHYMSQATAYTIERAILALLEGR